MTARHLHAAFAACLLAALSAAQDPASSETLLREVRELRARVEAVEAENAALKGTLRDRDADGAVEERINALLASEDGTTVKSSANPLTFIGEFRFRVAATLGDNGFGPGGVPSSTPVGPGANQFAVPDRERDGWWTDALMRMGILYDFAPDVTAYSEMRAKWAFGQSGATSSPFGLGSNGGVDGGPGGAGGSTGQNADYPVLLDLNTFVFVHQAWLETRNVFGAPELTFRIGRQEIALGGQFQFGAAEWYDGFNFDALRFDWTAETWRLTAIASKLQSVDADGNQRTSFFNSHDDDDLLALYFTYTGVADHAFDAYWILVNGHGGADDDGSGASVGALGNFVGDPAGSGGTAYYSTVGVRAAGLFREVAAGLDYGFEAAYQFGDGRGSPTGFPPIGAFDVDAFAVEASLGLTLDEESKLRVGIRALYAEGPSDDALAYTPLYPSRHAASGFRARYGLFDLLPMTNVFSLQGGVQFDPAEDWSLGATLLWGEADEAGLMPGNRRNGATLSAVVPDDDYGVEVDVWAEYRASSQMTFAAGLALLFPDDAGEALWLVDDGAQFYAYFQARLAF